MEDEPVWDGLYQEDKFIAVIVRRNLEFRASSTGSMTRKRACENSQVSLPQIDSL